jgi:hypothetical protein
MPQLIRTRSGSRPGVLRADQDGLRQGGPRQWLAARRLEAEVWPKVAVALAAAPRDLRAGPAAHLLCGGGPLAHPRDPHLPRSRPRGSTVSGRHWYSTIARLAVAALLPLGVNAWLTKTVRSALHHRSASYVRPRCHSPPQTWLRTSHVRPHRTHAPSATADVASASTQQSTAPTIRAYMAALTLAAEGTNVEPHESASPMRSGAA